MDVAMQSEEHPVDEKDERKEDNNEAGKHERVAQVQVHEHGSLFGRRHCRCEWRSTVRLDRVAGRHSDQMVVDRLGHIGQDLAVLALERVEIGVHLLEEAFGLLQLRLVARHLMRRRCVVYVCQEEETGGRSDFRRGAIRHRIGGVQVRLVHDRGGQYAERRVNGLHVDERGGVGAAVRVVLVAAVLERRRGLCAHLLLDLVGDERRVLDEARERLVAVLELSGVLLGEQRVCLDGHLERLERVQVAVVLQAVDALEVDDGHAELHRDDLNPRYTSNSSSGTNGESRRVLAVFGLDKRITEVALYDTFARHGCTECKLIIDKHVCIKYSQLS